MKRILLVALAWVIAGVEMHGAPVRRTIELATDWRFSKGEVAGAEAEHFKDSGWHTVSVPHDWSIEGPFEKNNPTGAAGAFLPSGVSFYRRHISVDKKDAGKRFFVEFEGVMAHSKVWMNGHLLGERPSGYVSFGYDLTPDIHFGGDNVLVVRTDTSQQPASRWYEGAGIYRKVHLVVEDPVHVVEWGTYVTTPEVSAAQAKVRVQVKVANQSSAAAGTVVRVRLIGPDGRDAGSAVSAQQEIAAGGDDLFDVTAVVKTPDRWDVAHPAMYRALAEVVRGGRVSDVDEVRFGIREFHFDAATGFWLNGKNFKLYGACLHEDLGAFGIAVPAEAYWERLRALKEMGVNAIRTAHNPPSPEFLELTDRMGLLVMDEMFDQWSVAKNPYDYHLDFEQWHVQDTKDTVMRDRNHPSIILWSAGNEIHDTPKADLAKEELKSIVDAFHEVDSTRPVTQALFRPNVSHDYDDGLADMLDVIGQNYRPNEILAAHEANPARKIVGTENTHDRDQWLPVRDNKAYSGEFIWSGADYLGEARRWPDISRSTGLLDRTNWPHVRGLERESWWSTRPVVHIARRVKPAAKSPTDPGYESQQMGGGEETAFADWTPESLEPHEEHVEVYSNCHSVELFLNGQSLGSKVRNLDDAPRLWEVRFAPGALRALCGDGTEETLRTAGRPDRIVLTAVRNNVGSLYDDVTQIRATVVDKAGVRVPRSSNLMRFTVTGQGDVVAVDNGDIASHESFQGTLRSAHDGMAVAYVRASANARRLRVTVSAIGLKSGIMGLWLADQ